MLRRTTSLYRRLLRQASLLKAGEAEKVKKEVKESFRREMRRGEVKEEEAEKMLAKAQSRLDFLLMTTPSSSRRSPSSSSNTFVFRDGKVVESRARRLDKQGFLDQRITTDMIDRHHQLLRRQYFLDR